MTEANAGGQNSEKINGKKPEENRRKNKPKFLRQNYKNLKRVGAKWRRPKGHQSKLRKRKKSHGKVPKIGYKSPEAASGLIDGLKPRRVFSPSDIDRCNPEKEIIIIASTVGLKKRKAIIEKAEKLGIKIRNLKKIKRRLHKRGRVKDKKNEENKNSKEKA